MEIKALIDIRKKVVRSSPLIHCITNPISINQCANVILEVGGRPIMAEHPDEVKEITASADALVLNTGNITDVRMRSMKLSAYEAFNSGKPVVIDAVGAACSEIRKKFVDELIKLCRPAIIKGNYSEIFALYDNGYKASGVDSDSELSEKKIIGICSELADIHNTVILASGKDDIISGGGKTVIVSNGTKELSKVTGTGCMLGALCGCFVSVGDPIDAAITACAIMGIAGELADSSKGLGSFAVSLMDAISTLTDIDIAKRLKAEVI